MRLCGKRNSLVIGYLFCRFLNCKRSSDLIMFLLMSAIYEISRTDAHQIQKTVKQQHYARCYRIEEYDSVFLAAAPESGEMPDIYTFVKHLSASFKSFIMILYYYNIKYSLGQ